MLAQLALVDGPAAKPSFVEGMAQWLGWAEAIPLSAALHAPLNAGAGHGPAGPSCAPWVAAPAHREFARVRAALVLAIDRPIEGDGTSAADVDFAPYRQRCITLQQAMEAGIGPLRALARAAVARLSPEMSRLAAMDAVMDEVLGAREQALLAAMPSLLQKHFERLLQAHRATAAASPEGDAPKAALPSGEWLKVFRQDMQRLLLAELDLRLQPVLGLLDTLHTKPQGFHE